MLSYNQSEMNRRMFVILDMEYEQFCPNQKGDFERPLRLKRCLYGGDFSDKSWHDTLDMFLTLELSRVGGCLYI